MRNRQLLCHSLILLFGCLALVALQPYDDMSDLRGNYCSEIGCCTNRKDTCSKPIIGKSENYVTDDVNAEFFGIYLISINF